MKSELLSQYPYTALIVLGMLIFLGIYLGWSWFALSRKRRAHFEALSKLPLED